MELIPEAETMSLDGHSGGVAIAGLSDVELRTVMYLVGYPNLLVSLHPDYVMTHLMTPLSVDRTHVECAWAFPREVAEQPDFDPSYAVDFWDLTNRQDWAACESVQRGLTSPHAQPGPLAPEEDGVYQFVTRVARAYRELESAGVIETRGRAGSFVTGDEVESSAKAAAASYAAQVRALGLSPDQALALVARALGTDGSGSR